MIIALDYDGTYTQDPAMWLAIIPVFRASGHEVFCCTMRTPEETHDMDPALLEMVQVVPTSRAAKAEFMKRLGVTVDVWIDDSPVFIVADAADRPAKRHTASPVLPSNMGKTKARLTLNTLNKSPVGVSHA